MDHARSHYPNVFASQFHATILHGRPPSSRQCYLDVRQAHRFRLRRSLNESLERRNRRTSAQLRELPRPRVSVFPLIFLLPFTFILRLAAIDFQSPYVLSGSSDKHLRLLDITSGQGWTTSPDLYESEDSPATQSTDVCRTCGSAVQTGVSRGVPQTTHKDLVRSVVLNQDFVVSGSYDHTVKVIAGSKWCCSR